jgi:serine/threonine protein kinase
MELLFFITQNDIDIFLDKKFNKYLLETPNIKDGNKPKITNINNILKLLFKINPEERIINLDFMQDILKFIGEGEEVKNVCSIMYLRQKFRLIQLSEDMREIYGYESKMEFINQDNSIYIDPVTELSNEINEGKLYKRSDNSMIDVNIFLIVKTYVSIQKHMFFSIGFYEDNNYIYIFKEKIITNMDLIYQYITSQDVDIRTKYHLTNELLNGMTDLHNKGISIRVVKPEFIITDGTNLKFINLIGLCSNNLTCGTIESLYYDNKQLYSPELAKSYLQKDNTIKNFVFYVKNDYWSLGVVIFYIFFKTYFLYDVHLTRRRVEQKNLDKLLLYSTTLTDEKILSHLTKFNYILQENPTELENLRYIAYILHNLFKINPKERKLENLRIEI